MVLTKLITDATINIYFPVFQTVGGISLETISMFFSLYYSTKFYRYQFSTTIYITYLPEYYYLVIDITLMIHQS